MHIFTFAPFSPDSALGQKHENTHFCVLPPNCCKSECLFSVCFKPKEGKKKERNKDCIHVNNIDQFGSSVDLKKFCALSAKKVLNKEKKNNGQAERRLSSTLKCLTKSGLTLNNLVLVMRQIKKCVHEYSEV